MARQSRCQYAGAVYHVMAHGDGEKQIFIRKEDHELFLYWLEKVCGSPMPPLMSNPRPLVQRVQGLSGSAHPCVCFGQRTIQK